MVRVILAAEPNDHRIDLDGVDVRRAVLQCRCHVRPRAGTEHQHVLERVPEDHVGPLVEVFLLLHRGHRLVKDVVDLDDRIGAVLADRDLVIRRPQRPACHHVNEAERQHQQRNVDADEHTARASESPAVRLAREQERHRRGEADPEPPRRRQLQPRDDGKEAHARQAAEQIQCVAAKRRQRGHLPAHALRERGKERRDDHEDQRQQHRAFDDDDLLGRAAREIDAARRLHRHFETEEVSGADNDRLQQREPGEQATPRRRDQAPDADAEKAGEENEVGEVRQEPDIGRHPPNQGDFEEQDKEGGEENPRASGVHECHR